MSKLRPMLATPFEPDRVVNQFPFDVQPKYDGIRARLQDGQLLSRSNKPIPNHYIRKTMEDAADILEGIDGELIVGMPNDPDVYRRTSSGVMSHGGEPDFRFWAFDIIDYRSPWNARWPRLYGLMHVHMRNFHWLRMTPTITVNSLEEIEKQEQCWLGLGYEGIVLRRHASFYKAGRATPAQGQLIKVKRFIDAEATVVGFDELLRNANEAFKNELGYTAHTSHQDNLVPADTLGALKCIGVYDDGTAYEVDIGTGFDAAQRQEIWDNRTNYMGKMVKFKYFDHGKKDKPRHPVFLGWRHPDDL